MLKRQMRMALKVAAGRPVRVPMTKRYEASTLPEAPGVGTNREIRPQSV